jgi:hypothetical protein
MRGTVTATILAADPTRRRNGAAIADAASLGYLPEPVVDPTYGEGGMWTTYSPAHLVAFDLDPDCGVNVADLATLPLPPGFAGSLVLDPPYKLGGTPTTSGGDGLMNARFGIDRYRTPDEVRQLYADGMAEASRVVRPGGFVLVKCMDQMSSARLHLQTSWCDRIADDLPLVLVDQLDVSHTPRPQRSQRTARKNRSQLMVFRRTGRGVTP